MAVAHPFNDPHSLNNIRPKRFLEYALSVAGLARGNLYHARHHAPCRGIVIHPGDFFALVYKFCDNYCHHPAKIEAIIRPAAAGGNRLFFWGVRDMHLRKKNTPRYLPEYQNGSWNCILEEVLEHGVSDEHVRAFRKSLCMRQEDDPEFDDTFFFQIPPDIPL